MQELTVKNFILIFGSVLSFGLTMICLSNYYGNACIYLLFTATSYLLLFLGFRKNAIFFDSYIAVFFFLGFWLKFTIRVSFTNSKFHESVGSFVESPEAFDRALLVSICGFLGLILATFIREKFIFKYPWSKSVVFNDEIKNYYLKYRRYILIVFFILILTISSLNIYFGIYQKGSITQTTLPLGMNGIIKWLLLFGLLSFLAVLLNLEILLKSINKYILYIICMLEIFFTNVSMLSRGMVLTYSALLYGMFSEYKIRRKKIPTRLFININLVFIPLFVISIYTVNLIREHDFKKLDQYDLKELDLGVSNVHRAIPLILDRWVGIEGVMTVSSSNKIGWDLLVRAVDEKYDEKVASFYDSNLISSPYIDNDFSKKHPISLPGILAFFFYPGSFIFLFFCMFALGLLAGLIEYFVFYLGQYNLILCSLMAQVVSYRYSNFGYVPSNSYLILSAIFLNLLIIFLLFKIIHKWVYYCRQNI